MATLRIEDLAVGGIDASGNKILTMFVRKTPVYAVYREPTKVAVHFADDPRREAKQRAALAALNPLRGQISGLIDGWRTSDEDLEALDRQRKHAHFPRSLWQSARLSRLRRNRCRADRYDRRVADAMVVGLEGGIADALALLTEIRDEVKAERRSFAETDYLLWAALAGVVFMGAIWLISSIGLFPNPPERLNLVWTGAGVGVLGAFFSIATGLRNRAILIDLQKWDNRRDAILRIAVGTIGAGIVLSLILAQLVNITGITDKVVPATPGDAAANSMAVTMAAVIGFLAGFSERAVGNLLATATGALTAERKAEDVAAAQAKAAAQPGAVAAAAAAAAEEDVVEEVTITTDHPELGIDACLCDAPPLDSEILTKDEDLPVAVGGVSADVAPPALAPVAVADVVEQAKQIIQETVVTPEPEETGGEPGKPKADIPAE